ncbi:MAG: hypothetical protein E7538_02510 [Ruminococcaceae bacterium]|nr:hypothetical protein [Oscillospiraceae bacterium]
MSRGVFGMNKYKENIKLHMPALPNPHLEPIIELTSNREAIIEGCSGIVEYNDGKAAVSCKSLLIAFEGTDISLKTLSGDCVSVTGTFSAISFSSL